MSRNATSQAQNLRALAEDWSEEAAARLRVAIKATGQTQEQISTQVPISRQRLAGIVNFKIHPSQIAFDRICEVLGKSIQEITGGIVAKPSEEIDGSPRVFRLPALADAASAGNGNIIQGEALFPSQFYFAEDWLRRTFGSVGSLCVVEVKGASQEPDLRNGDWVMVDQSRQEIEDGLAVLRLDDALLVKRLQKDGHMLHLLSKNPEYLPTTLDLRKDEERVKIIGKVIYSFKAL